MPRKPAEKSSPLGVIAGVAAILALVVAVIYFWPGEEPRTVEEVTPDAVPTPKTAALGKMDPEKPTPGKPAVETPKPVIDYNRIAGDESAKGLMKNRKAAYGIEKEVDLIAREDETIRIGDFTVPMEEILSKIRLKEGEILESDLGGEDAPPTKLDEKQRLANRIEAVEKKIAELTRLVNSPAPDGDPGETAPGEPGPGKTVSGGADLPEGQALLEVIDKLREYKETLQALREAKEQRDRNPNVDDPELNDRIIALESRLDELEGRLNDYLPVEAYEKSSGLFGIYVVKPGDNIWNIHFQFLKAFFGNKGVTLSPLADEATENGRSSGVGKLLKFSEGRVYIYNLKERKLDVNLHLIHPRSKIVIFKFAEFFAMLDQIDSQNVHHIEFDGETLWMPPAQ